MNSLKSIALHKIGFKREERTETERLGVLTPTLGPVGKSLES